VATYPDRAAVLEHLADWLENGGIDPRSALAGKVATAQAQLRERFAHPHY
jgi:hypothetical protein